MTKLPKLSIEITLGQPEIGIRFLDYDEPIEEFDRTHVNLLRRAIEQASKELEKISLDVHVKEINREVESWPKWKQNLLTDSLSPTIKVPRKPIINEDLY